MSLDYTALIFPRPPADRPYVIMNMVMSADGRSAFADGTERGLGSATDQRLMRELRVHPDVIIGGAGTLRATGLSPRFGDHPELENLRLERGKQRLATSATITRGRDLPLDRPFFTARDFDAIVYLAHDAEPGSFDRIAATGRAVAQLPRERAMAWMLAHMRFELGANLVLVEGGPTLNGLLFAESLVDELFVTVGARIAGGSHDGLVAGPGYTRDTGLYDY